MFGQHDGEGLMRGLGDWDGVGGRFCWEFYGMFMGNCDKECC